jgi:DNA-binding XRE family transcriptional regulator
MRNRQVQNAVREVRTKRGMSQQELAELTRLARQSIISIEKGRFLPTIESALRLSAALDVPVGELFWLSERNR